MTTTVLAYIPSPAQGVWQLGPVPLRAYALFIIAGIIAGRLVPTWSQAIYDDAGKNMMLPCALLPEQSDVFSVSRNLMTARSEHCDIRSFASLFS